MNRPQFTVVRKNGIRLDANHITIGRVAGFAASVPSLTFMCSGEMLTFPASDIEEVVYHGESDASWCSSCGQTLTPDKAVVG